MRWQCVGQPGAADVFARRRECVGSLRSARDPFHHEQQPPTKSSVHRSLLPAEQTLAIGEFTLRILNSELHTRGDAEVVQRRDDVVYQGLPVPAAGLRTPLAIVAEPATEFVNRVADFEHARPRPIPLRGVQRRQEPRADRLFVNSHTEDCLSQFAR